MSVDQEAARASASDQGAAPQDTWRTAWKMDPENTARTWVREKGTSTRELHVLEVAGPKHTMS